MHAPAQPLRTWRQTPHYFLNDYAAGLIEEFNTTGNQRAIEALIAHVEPLTRSIAEYRNTVRHVEFEELMSRVRIKVWKSVRLYDPAKGTPFSFVAKVISSTAQSAVGEAWSRNERFTPFCDCPFEFSARSELSSRAALAEIEHRVRQVKTSCSDSYELQAQRWFVESFLDAGFHLRRHEMCDAVMLAFGLTHSRSRQLHDLLLVAIRRELVDGRRLAPVTPASLLHTRSEALVRFAKHLNAEEFTRLAILCRDVAPSVVSNANPQNRGAIIRGDAAAIRANLNLVLWGSLCDRPLFPSMPSDVL